MRVAVVFGTRPEIIKLASVVHALRQGERSAVVTVHTGQHYDESMSQRFLVELGLPPVDVHLRAAAEGLGGMVRRVTEALERVRPDLVVVQGDTNSALAGALAAVLCGVRLAHVEAGLRCFDPGMREEVNRVAVDHLSDLLFAPTLRAASHLASEGVRGGVHVVGNTVVDAVEKVMGPAMDAIEKCAGSAAVRDVLPLPRTYAIATLHRAANTDNAERLREWLTAFRDIASQGLSVRLAVHPRLGRRLDEFGLRPLLAHGTGVTVEEPMGYREFLEALAGACVVLTDSGGVQEEACVLQVPCLTLRPHTERPETVEVGANRVVPSGREAVAAALEAMRAPGRQWPNPLGDGHAGERIAGLCCAAVVSAAAPRWALPGR